MVTNTSDIWRYFCIKEFFRGLPSLLYQCEKASAPALELNLHEY
jgi:hypothetical protein